MNNKKTIISKTLNCNDTTTFQTTLEDEIRLIQNPTKEIRELIDKIRELKKSGSDIKPLKRRLPALMINGYFEDRKKENGKLLQYSNVTCLDFDNFKTYPEVFNFKYRLDTNFLIKPYIYAMFLSPSGLGLKVLIKHNNKNPEEHYKLFESLKELFERENLATNLDKSCKDLRRLTFISYDDSFTFYFNQDSLEFNYESDLNNIDVDSPFPFSTPPIETTTIPEDLGDERILRIFRSNWNKRNVAIGNRNQNLFSMAFECVKGGINKNLTEEVLMKIYLPLGLSKNEISTTISNAYNYSDKFGIKRNWINERYASK